MSDVDNALDAVVEALGGQRREGQHEMANAVATAISEGSHVIVQAGTGTGKSFGYLVPAAVHAATTNNTVVVATATLALQRQLVERDLPRLAEALEPVMARPVTFAVLKGRRNYVCLDRLRRGPADDDTPGIPSPIATMERLIAENPKNAEVIFPYIGGEEVNSSPTHAHHRYVINFGERSEEECRRVWPELMQIVERKVKPERLKVNDKGAKQKWWLFIRPRPELNAAVEGHAKVIVTARHQPNWQLAFMPPTSVFSEAMVVFALESTAWMLLAQSDVHELWARFLGSSMKDDLRYTPSDCFETFPFPAALCDSAANDPSHAITRKSLEAIGERYHQFRAELMVTNNEGLTSTYNRFHDPAETSPGLLELRRLHGEMDQTVLQAYGWSDVSNACGFGLDYLDSDDDSQLPDGLQERIDSGNLFFWDAGDALDFQGQLEAYGAISGRRKLPWRYRWPDAVRDDVLARLLALNAERYSEEVAQGLHGKGSKKPAGPATPGGKRRGRPPKAAQAGETEAPQAEQMGLVL
jgi:hypothetical protein